MVLNGCVGTPDDSPYSLAPGRLGAAAVTFFALAAMAPLAVLGWVVPRLYARGGGPLVPLTFAALAVVLLLFCGGYAAMARRAPFAGALYAYVARGLGRPAAIAAAWGALLSYHLLQLGLYGIAGAAAVPLLHGWFGVRVAWWAAAGACWVLVALLGVVRVEIIGGLMALLVLTQTAVIAGFAAVNVIEPAGGGLTAGTVLPAGPAAIDRPALGLLLAAGMLGFVGFETAGTYAEEAMRPRRDPGHAAYTAVVLAGLLLFVASSAMGAAAGPGSVTASAGARGPELVFDLAAARLPGWAVTAGRVVLLTALVAAVLSVHAAVTRYLFALGRERVLPAVLARTARRAAVPRTASLIQSLVVLVELVCAYAVGVADPAPLARRMTVAGGLGILLLLLATALSALLHLNRVPDGEGLWGRFAAPLLSTVALGALAYLAVRNLPGLLGVPPDGRLAWLVPAALGAVTVLGMAHAWGLRRSRPLVYAGIGHGGPPVGVTPVIPKPREPGAHRPGRVDR